MIYGLVAQLRGKIPLQKDPPPALDLISSPLHKNSTTLDISQCFSITDLGHSLKHSQVTRQAHSQKVTSSIYMALPLMKKTIDLYYSKPR